MSFRLQLRTGVGIPAIGTNTKDQDEPGLKPFEIGLNLDTPEKPLLYTNIPDGSGGAIVGVAAEDANSLGGVLAIDYARLDGIPGDNGIVAGGVGEDNGSAVFQGDVKVNGILYATAESAKYADIAEYYETDNTYSPGDILMIGNETECSIADGNSPLMGVCSTQPAYVMNNQIEELLDEDGEKLVKHFAPIALKGRIPVKITGSAKRGQYIILDLENPGMGKAVNKITKTLDRDCNFIGICITEGTDTCEVKV